MSPLIRIIALLLLICAFCLAEVHNKSIYGIGNRIVGDQLLVKDVLQARPAGVDENAKIRFNYEVPEPITLILISSEQNVIGDVKFSYHNNLVEGTVTAVNSSRSFDEIDVATTETTTVASSDDAAISAANFKVEIQIFGFNSTILNLSPALLLNRDTNYEGTLEPEYYEDSEEGSDFELVESTESQEPLIRFDNLNTNEVGDNDDDDDELHQDYNDGDEDLDNWDADIMHNDKIIELGKRQKDDHLIYDSFQTSLTTSKDPTNHSVVFYYIDSDYITYVKFVVFDHIVDRTATDYNPPVAEYTHFSPTTLKAVITDYRTTSLFVRMYMYGYQPSELPVDYVSFLISSLGVSAGIDMATDTPTLLSRLRSKAELQSRLNKELTKLQKDDDNGDGDDDNDEANVDDDDDVDVDVEEENVAESQNENAKNDGKSLLSCLEQTISDSGNSMPKGLSIVRVVASSLFLIGFSAVFAN